MALWTQPLLAFVRRKLVSVVETAITNVWQRRVPIDYERVAYVIAAREAADFFLHSMRMVPNLVSRTALLDHAVKSVSLEGLWMEFGVYRGEDLGRIAAVTPSRVFGFDSFEGLPEDWTHFQRRGRFSLEGRLPEGLPDNVTLVRGWFEETLPPFLNNYVGRVAFLHVDSDLYSSARTVLQGLRSRIVDGTIIVFDDFLNYPGWQEGEYKAFKEFLDSTGLGFEYIGFASAHHSVALRVRGLGSS